MPGSTLKNSVALHFQQEKNDRLADPNGVIILKNLAALDASYTSE
jgi:hypothetical protein